MAMADLHKNEKEAAKRSKWPACKSGLQRDCTYFLLPPGSLSTSLRWFMPPNINYFQLVVKRLRINVYNLNKNKKRIC
jgi:hypothetical protein